MAGGPGHLRAPSLHAAVDGSVQAVLWAGVTEGLRQGTQRQYCWAAGGEPAGSAEQQGEPIHVQRFTLDRAVF